MAHKVVKAVRAYQSHTAPVGPHLADQLMIPLALAALQGRAGNYLATELTEHARTNALVIEKFLPVAFSMTPLNGGFAVSVSA